MFVMLFLEVLGGAVGVYNLSKGVLNMYTDAEKLRRAKEEYQHYIDLQSRPIDPLTQSQYQCYEEGFAII